MKPETEFTDEHILFAANFMGWTISNMNLMSLPEMEIAVMDRAVEKGYQFIFFQHYPEYVRCHIGEHLLNTKDAVKGPTRFTALLNALMEARGR